MSEGTLSDFTSAFLSESEELLAVANRELLAVEAAARRGSRHSKGVREAFRAVHTIKGLAGMVGVEPIVSLSHRLEGILRASDRSGRPLTPSTIDLLISGLRVIQQYLRAVASNTPLAAPPAALVDGLEEASSASGPAPGRRYEATPADPVVARLSEADREQVAEGLAAGKRAVVVEFVPSPAQAEQGINITSVRTSLAALGEIVKAVPLSRPGQGMGGVYFAIVLLTLAPNEAVAEAAHALPAAVSDVKHAAPPPDSRDALDNIEEESVAPGRRDVVRVDVARLDEAMDRLSALIVTRFRLTAAVKKLADSGVGTRELDGILKENGRQLRDLRAAILQVRMVRLTEVLEGIPLLVRGLCRSTGKKVVLEINAGATELDKKVAERVFPALVHLIRNAIDHAIELPEERRAAGKAEEGRLAVTCLERSNTELEISIADDGRGIDRDRVAAKARQPVPATEAGLLDLICQPGLSTRTEATTTSGRGMGMDIVKRIVTEQLGGELTMTTGAGRGTTFTLRIPLTITILDAFSLECASQRFVVPVSAVEEILELDPSSLVKSPSRRAEDHALGMVVRRGEAVPVIGLDVLFRLPAPTSQARKALVVRRAGLPVAFAVDRMMGQHEVVVRPLEDPLVRVPGVGGSTDLGDGMPTLVLDLPALAGRYLKRRGAEVRA